MKTYYVYIVASRSRTLYTGITNNLERRVVEHRTKFTPGFTARYNIHRLVYFETWGDVRAAIAREKQIKSWGRMKKIRLIESKNRDWKDLSAGWPGSPVNPRGRNQVPGRVLSRTKIPSALYHIKRWPNGNWLDNTYCRVYSLR